LDTCEEAEKIDVNRAKEAADRAKKRLQEQSEKIDVARAEAAFARATNRLKVVQKVNVTA
jgi:F-type H+-transporting ATPase subunit epsilon